MLLDIICQTGDSHRPMSSQSHRPIIPLPNGNRTGKLWVRVYPQVGSGSNFWCALGMGTGKHHWLRVQIG